MSRLLRIAGSLAIVLAAYGTYALVAVPLIEPSADLRRSEQISEQDRETVNELSRARVQRLVGLFPPGAWELKNPKILESDQLKLLFQEYRNLGDGWVELQPCTLIFTPRDAGDDPAGPNRQAIILEAPKGAKLEFDESLDLRRLKIGRLEGGELRGPITIHGRVKQAGSEDNLPLLIKTREIQLTGHHVWTEHPVDFRLGPHYGRGREMRIELLGDEASSNSTEHGPNITGIASFEVRHVERLHLELGKTKLASGKLPATPASDLPVEVACRGPFRFDVIEKVATFKDQVDVLRLQPQGPSDQLTCELLSIFFADRTEAAPGDPDDRKDDSEKSRARSFDLEPKRIEARGDPVVLTAPSQQVRARGQRLEYDLQTKRIVLDGTHEVLLQRGPDEIHARNLQYQDLGPGRLGRIVAEGPGWLRGQMDERPDMQLEARWNEALRVQPHQENQVISLSGGAALKFHGFGQLEAGEIHLWLWESPPEAGSEEPPFRPDRMLARDQVKMDSPKFSGDVEQLEVWFEQMGEGEGGRGEGGRWKVEGGRGKDQLPTADGQPDGPQSVGVVGKIPDGLQSIANRLPSTAYRLPSGGQEQQHFEIAGRLLQARVVIGRDEQPELSELIVEDGVRFVETQTAEPEQQPLSISGDRLHAVGADKPHASVTVTGTPARFKGRGLSLTGTNINLNRGTNRLWIDGPGQMDLPLDKDLEGHPLPNPGRLEIRWQKGMEFDGRTARFEEKVTAVAPPQLNVQTETLEVQMNRVIRFSDPELPEDAEADQLIEQLRCHGGVLMENRTFEGPAQTSHERMQVADLTVHLGSGALSAAGPGWFRSVRYGSDDLLGPRNSVPLAVGGTSHSTNKPAVDGDDRQLRCIEVRFQGQITGNVKQNTMTFHDQVHTVYGPVDSWQSTLEMNDPAALGPGGVILRCEQLSVGQMVAPMSSRRTLELEAALNVVAEGNEGGYAYTARGARLTYAEAKDLLILEGDGRTDAKLYRQKQVGGHRDEFSARKILYWPKTGRLNVEGARNVELNGLPTSDPGK